MGSSVSLAISKFKSFLKDFKTDNPISITILGLDAAGKTSLLSLLNGNPLNTIPTLGFNHETVKIENTTLKLWDIGGQQQFISFWEDYIRGISGLIFIIDISDKERFHKAYEAFKGLVDSLNENIPILMILNKTDLVEDKKELEERIKTIYKMFNIVGDKMVFSSKTFVIKVVVCSILGEYKKLASDITYSISQTSLYQNIKWLIRAADKKATNEL